MAPPGDATHCTLDGLGYVIVCIAGAVFLLNSSLDLNIFDQLVAHTINDCSIKTRDTGVYTGVETHWYRLASVCPYRQDISAGGYHEEIHV